APCGCPDSREADVVTAAPVARDRAERGKTRVPPVWSNAEAVDPGTAHDRDPPAPFGTRAQHGEGVVADRDLLGKSTFAHGGADVLFLGWEVDAREQKLCDVRCGPVSVRQAGVAEGSRKQILEDVNTALDAEMVR